VSEMTPDEFWSILHSAPVPLPVSYKLYYDDHGMPIIYSMEDIPGNYIEVGPEVYAVAPFNVQVVSGKLTYTKPKIVVKQLQPGAEIGTACDPRDVCVVVGSDQAHIKWNIVNNELN